MEIHQWRQPAQFLSSQRESHRWEGLRCSFSFCQSEGGSAGITWSLLLSKPLRFLFQTSPVFQLGKISLKIRLLVKSKANISPMSPVFLSIYYTYICECIVDVKSFLLLQNWVDGAPEIMSNGAWSLALWQPASTPASIKARILIICDCLQSAKLKIPLERSRAVGFKPVRLQSNGVQFSQTRCKPALVPWSCTPETLLGNFILKLLLCDAS